MFTNKSSKRNRNQRLQKTKKQLHSALLKRIWLEAWRQKFRPWLSVILRK